MVKKDWLCVAGGGLCFCGQAVFGAPVFFGLVAERGLLLPPRFTPLRVGSRKPIFLADTMILLVDVSYAAPSHDVKVYPSSLVLMPRTLQVVYSRDDYCLFAVFPTGVL
jgi:hypothetical protein